MTITTVAELIEAHEGTRPFVYDDATGQQIVPGYTVIGHPTIGTGRALDTHGIDGEEAAALLKTDISYAEHALVGLLGWPQASMSSLGEPRHAALVDMAFELGAAGLAKFTHMIAAVKAGDWETAAAEALASEWAAQVPARAKMDAEILRTGEWPK